MKGTVYDKYVKIQNELRHEFHDLDKKDFFKITAKLPT